MTTYTDYTTIFRFSLPYFIVTIILLAIEVFIAQYTGSWMRNYVGDVFVVILVYTAVKSVLNINNTFAIIGTLIFACSVEVSQYFHLAELLGFVKGSIPYIVLGNTFSAEDLVCYVLGGFVIILMEEIYNEH